MGGNYTLFTLLQNGLAPRLIAQLLASSLSTSKFVFAQEQKTSEEENETRDPSDIPKIDSAFHKSVI